MNAVLEMKIGVLAIQGDFAAHARALGRIGCDAAEVRRADDLEAVRGLVMPGGESTTMLKLLTEENFIGPIKEFAGSGRPILGTCAGAILLARAVFNPEQPSLGLINITIERNAYGRQINSFIREVEDRVNGGKMEAVFIRAPKIRNVGPGVCVLAADGKDPVLVRENNIFAATFHPELTDDERVHRLFAQVASQAQGA